MKMNPVTLAVPVLPAVVHGQPFLKKQAVEVDGGHFKKTLDGPKMIRAGGSKKAGTLTKGDCHEERFYPFSDTAGVLEEWYLHPGFKQTRGEAPGTGEGCPLLEGDGRGAYDLQLRDRRGLSCGLAPARAIRAPPRPEFHWQPYTGACEVLPLIEDRGGGGAEHVSAAHRRHHEAGESFTHAGYGCVPLQTGDRRFGKSCEGLKAESRSPRLRRPFRPYPGRHPGAPSFGGPPPA